MDLKNIYINSLKTGFVDKNITSKKEFHPEVITNNIEKGIKFLTSIKNEMNTCEEFILSAAFLTTGGVASLHNLFEELERKKVTGKILVSQYQNFTQPEALRKILKFKNIQLKIAINNNFHAKGYFFKKKEGYTIIVGSSNLTQNALSLNKEWNLKVFALNESKIVNDSLNEFYIEFDKALKVDNNFIDDYELLFNRELEKRKESNSIRNIQDLYITPNSMQTEALRNLEDIRKKNLDKALLISATGTGKTYLSAFDVKNFNPKKFLFIVHRRNIAIKAKDSFERILGKNKSMGLYSGSEKSINSDYIFSTIQTISKDEDLQNFSKDHFDYIVIDETHRAGAPSYQKVLNYFKPKFLLGMSATPERSDGFDIFKQFNHTIAYEIRLDKALKEKMLSPFHYYGVADISVDGNILDENSNFSLLTSEERVNQIIEKANFYGTDSGITRGLIFCSSKKECIELSNKFNQKGYNTIYLLGDSSEEERNSAISLLEKDDSDKEKLDYIFSVDIFNEGIDIPKVNQIIMLRPTQSAIVFVQQLGRGLRKEPNKDYLTVIDFIGNYSNNYLIPIALFGDKTYEKDHIRKLLFSKECSIPGASTIDFDEISKEKIFESINKANLQLKKDLVNDYNNLKFKLGKLPLMIDFLEYGDRNPESIINYSKSYFNFINDIEDSFKDKLNEIEIKLLELFANEIANSKRIGEIILLKYLIKNKKVNFFDFINLVYQKYNYEPSKEEIESLINNLNFGYITEKFEGKLVSVQEKYSFSFIKKEKENIILTEEFKLLLENTVFKTFLEDNLNYSEIRYNLSFKDSKYIGGFMLYNKYSRKDVFRIINFDKKPLEQNVGGYLVCEKQKVCPIFVTYHKSDEISDSIKYDDGFINRNEIIYMSKSKRKLTSKDVIAIGSNNYRLPLFIKKDDDEGMGFYYMGDIVPVREEFEETTMDSEKNISIVKMKFKLKEEVEESIYNYITENKLN